MRVVLLSGDLMLASAAQGAANRRRAALVVAPDAATAIAASADSDSRLMVVDLRSRALDLEALVKALRGAAATQVHIMACGPHVHEATLARAAAAGCDEVVTRGEFERRLDATLARLASRTD
jgi:DNA-binding response OmpR family regulator